MDDFVRVNERGGFIINEYNGSFSLVSAWEGKDGVIRKNWAKYQKGKDEYEDKARPIKIELRSKDNAEQSLLTTLKAITGKSYIEKPADDAPF